MPAPTIKITTTGNAVLTPTDGEAIRITGTNPRVAVNGVPAGGIVQVWDYRTKHAPPLATLDKAPFECGLPMPVAGQPIPFGVEIRARHQQVALGKYTLALKATTDTDPLPPAPPSKGQVPPRVQTPRLAGKMRIGLCDGNRGEPRVMVPLYAPLRIATLAPWIGTRNFDLASVDDDGDIDSAIALAAAGGYTIAWRLAQSGMTSALAKSKGRQWHKAQAAFIRAKMEANPKTAGQRRRYQVGNEPDHVRSEYFAEGPAAYVRDYLPNAAEGIREADPDAEIIAAGFSHNQGEFEANADEMAKHADALAAHYYPKNVSDTGTLLGAAVKSAAVRGKPLIVTEANLGYGKQLKTLTGDKRAKLLAKWAADVPAYLIAAEAAGVSEAWYFLGWDAGTTASPAHLFDKSSTGVVTTPFYAALAGAMPR